MSTPLPPIVIVKRRKQTPVASHRGAWKVAYADFTTAMMAFFLVMWMVNQSQDVRSSVQAYFQDPDVFAQGRAPGAIAVRLAERHAGPTTRTLAASSAPTALDRAAARIRDQIGAMPAFRNLEDQIEVTVTREGLRIELQDDGQHAFFETGSAEVSAQTREVLQVIAKELASLPQSLAIEGHTDATPFGGDRAYTNWELSTDRANAARRIMQDAGLPAARVTAVRGYADTLLRTPAEPTHPRNRRVSIVVQHREPGRVVRASGTAHVAPAGQPPAGGARGAAARAGF